MYEIGLGVLLFTTIVMALVGSPIKRVDAVGVTVLSRSEDIANARVRFENGCASSQALSRLGWRSGVMQPRRRPQNHDYRC